MPPAGGPVPRPRPEVQQLRPYRRKVMPPGVDLRLDGNEGALPDPTLAAVVPAAGPELLRRYPSAAQLEDALASKHDVPADRVLVTAGGDEGLDRIFRAFGGPGRSAVLPEPTFEMLPRYAALTQTTLSSVPWPDGPFPVAAALAATDASTALLFVVTPNNPTGAVATTDELLHLARALPHVLVVLDHAYAEFGDDDLTDAALQHANVVVVRTFSKAFGLAGLRVGYLLGAPPVLDALRTAGSPYTVAGTSLLLALRALDRLPSTVTAYVQRVRTERGQLARTLRDHGFAVPESQANFVMARGPRAAWLWSALRGLGIAVRHFAERAGLEDALRITCPGNAPDFDRLLASIETALAPQALLFDLDGVLADVSGSYTEATIRTAAMYGVVLTRDDVSRGKRAGSANDDWVLTQRLLRERGVEADLAEVTLQFERLYQGDAGQPGLRATETALLDLATWRRWALRLPLGIVTGRPRADAERFLREHGYREHCRVVVCHEDGPLKPDPAPVRRALQQLGCQHAWFVGDTRDDLDAGRRAGAVPIGVIAPGDAGTTTRDHLHAHGAARVFERVDELSQLLLEILR